MFILVSLYVSAKMGTGSGGGSVTDCGPDIIVSGDRVGCVEERCIVCVVESAQSLLII